MNTSVSARNPMAAIGGPTTPEEQQLYENFRSEMAKFYRVASPSEVQPVLWIKPEERSLYQDPCVKEAGFAQLADGSWKFAPEQTDEFNIANYECAMKYPTIPKYSAPWTDDQTRTLYQYMVNSEIPCLESEGYQITGVPSEEVFVSRYLRAPFFPYEQLSKQGVTQNDELARLEEKCPQMPPSEVLYP